MNNDLPKPPKKTEGWDNNSQTAAVTSIVCSSLLMLLYALPLVRYLASPSDTLSGVEYLLIHPIAFLVFLTGAISLARAGKAETLNNHSIFLIGSLVASGLMLTVTYIILG